MINCMELLLDEVAAGNMAELVPLCNFWGNSVSAQGWCFKNKDFWGSFRSEIRRVGVEPDRYRFEVCERVLTEGDAAGLEEFKHVSKISKDKDANLLFFLVELKSCLFL